jgi:hypothetical protein
VPIVPLIDIVGAAGSNAVTLALMAAILAMKLRYG